MFTLLKMNRENINAIADHNFTEVTTITCECCGKQGVVAHLENLCTHCQRQHNQYINRTIEAGKYEEFMALHLGTEYVSQMDRILFELGEGGKYVIRFVSKYYGELFKAARMFSKEPIYARTFDTKAEAEKIAKKYANGYQSYQVIKLSEVM